MISEGPFSHEEVNVEAQRRDPGSLLNWTARMIRMRKECPEIGWGAWTALNTRSAQILALCYEWRGNSVVIIHNFSSRPHEARFSLNVEGGDRLADLLTDQEIDVDDDGVHRIQLEAFGYRWYRVGGLSYALRPGRDSGAGEKW